jgi:hypothetical protein
MRDLAMSHKCHNLTHAPQQMSDGLRFTRSPRQHGREARAAFGINYDGNPGQDGRLAGPALQV